jgi:predicted RND superfamily exporter protein
VIILTLIIAVLCSSGIMKMKNEIDPLKLWVPKDSDFVKNFQTVTSTIEQGFGPQYMLIVSEEDVLTPQIMRKLYVIDETIRNISIKKEKNETVKFNDICVK